MSEGILRDIKQTKPSSSAEEEAFVNIQRTADVLLQTLTSELKAFGLSPAQYNVLRILRGASLEGLPCGEIGARMITRDPDITRLLDRLEARGLVGRSRENKDRRIIVTRITEAGRELLGQLDGPIIAMYTKSLGHMGTGRLGLLNELLEEARSKIG